MVSMALGPWQKGLFFLNRVVQRNCIFNGEWGGGGAKGPVDRPRDNWRALTVHK